MGSTRSSPCGACGDVDQRIAIQVGRLLFCTRCATAIPRLFFDGDDDMLAAVWGVPISTFVRNEALCRAALDTTDASARAHFELGAAYRAQGLVADALLEYAISAAFDPQGALESEALCYLLEPVARRGSFAMLARAVGIHVRTVRSS